MTQNTSVSVQDLPEWDVFKKQLVTQKINPVTLKASLEDLSIALTQNRHSIIDYPHFMQKIMEEPELSEQDKIELIDVFLKAGYPHDTPWPDPLGSSKGEQHLSVATGTKGSYVFVSKYTHCLLLHSAVGQNYAAMVGHLLEHGEDINAIHEGRNALSYAAREGLLEMFNALIARGAKPLNHSGLLCCSLKSRSEPMIHRVLELQIRHFKPDRHYYLSRGAVLPVALHYRHSIDLIKDLVARMKKKGVFNAGETYEGGLNILHKVVEARPTEEMALFFLEQGARANHKSEAAPEMGTPIEFARQKGYNELAIIMEQWSLAYEEQKVLEKSIKRVKTSSSKPSALTSQNKEKVRGRL